MVGVPPRMPIDGRQVLFVSADYIRVYIPMVEGPSGGVQVSGSIPGPGKYHL